MPNHGKGGRKPLRGEAKRSAVAVRTTSAIKAALEQAAAEENRSVTQEVEDRLEASLAMDMPKRSAATMRLLVKIAEDIERAEAITGKGWHKDLMTWAMVREALATGAIERACPEKFLQSDEGEIPNEAQELREKRDAIDADISELRAFLRRTGFWENVKEGTLGFLIYIAPDYDAERARAAELPENLAAIIRPILDQLETAENERRIVEREYLQGFEWTAAAITEGVKLWLIDQMRRGIRVITEYRPDLARPIEKQLAMPRAYYEPVE